MGKPFGGRRPAWARSPHQSRSSVENEAPPCRVDIGQALLLGEGLYVGQAAILVALEAHALAARHLGQLLQGEQQELAVVADDRDAVAFGRRAHRSLIARADIQHLLALARRGNDLVLRHDEAMAARAGDQQLAAFHVLEQLDRIRSFLDVDHQAEGLAVATPARQLVGAERVEAAIGGEEQQRVGGLGGTARFSRSPSLKARPSSSARWPLMARIQPFSESTTVTGSFSIRASAKSSAMPSGATSKLVRRWPSSVFWPKRSFSDLISSAIFFHCLSLRGEQRLQLFPLLGQGVVLAPDLHLLELAQGAEPHIEDRLGLHLGELERLHQGRLRLILLADDFDDLVDVEIDDQEAVEHLEPVVDLAEAMLRAADQHLQAVVEPFAQDLAKAQHVRHLAAGQHIHVERHARLELGQLEHLLHEEDGIDGAALRLEHEAHVFRRLVANVGEERQLLCLEQLGDAGDEARLRDLIWESR